MEDVGKIERKEKIKERNRVRDLDRQTTFDLSQTASRAIARPRDNKWGNLPLTDGENVGQDADPCKIMAE
jgi:hypothetical protein